MFKYLKTANSNCHPGEIVEFYAYNSDAEDAEVPVGSIFSIEEGMVQLSCNTSSPLYLALNGKKNDEEAYIKGLPILSDMIFEAPLAPNEEAEIVFKGSLCYLYTDKTGKGIGVAITLSRDEATFEVLDISNIKNRKITVRKI